MADNERIIKKYGNRRLYDTFDSRYIAFGELQELIAKGIPLKIIDAKTHEEVTYSVILSLILANTQLVDQFSDSLLKNIIRLYGYGEQQRTMFGDCFQKSLEVFVKAQVKFNNPMGFNAMEYVTELTDQHQKLAQRFMDDVLRLKKPD